MALFNSDTMLLLATLLVSMAAFSCLWVVSLGRNDASIVDWYWGLGFGVIAILYALAHGAGGPGWLLVLFTAAWSLRLTIHLVRRHAFKGVEDARYAAMRTAGGPTFKRDSLYKIFLLQAVIMWIIATPLHAGVLFADGMVRSIPFILGSALFLAGALFEAVADHQLDRFSRRPENKGRLLTDGLFAWCRHPNYFGEAVLWWGLGLLGFALSGAWWSFVGPAILTFLLIKVSGVPLLDQHLSSRPGWADYAARTPAFIPRQPQPARTSANPQINP